MERQQGHSFLLMSWVIHGTDLLIRSRVLFCSLQFLSFLVLGVPVVVRWSTEASSSGHDSPISVLPVFCFLTANVCIPIQYGLSTAFMGSSPFPFVAVAFLYPALFHFVDIFCSLAFISLDSVMAFIVHICC